MRLLEALIKQQPKNVHNQILGWLCWLKNYCNNRPCLSCEFYAVDVDLFRCGVRNAYRDIIKSTQCIIPPNNWNIPLEQITPEKPPSLEFLKDLYWTEEGSPISPPKGK